MLGATVKYHTIEHGDKHKIPVSKWPIRFEIFQPFVPNISTMKIVFDNLRGVSFKKLKCEWMLRRVSLEQTFH